ncbi:40S ribosomal protein S12 [Tephrocybe rancida]|nr:40S ribosomal protein S12 [Tephrocybe rancida]
MRVNRPPTDHFGGVQRVLVVAQDNEERTESMSDAGDDIPVDAPAAEVEVAAEAPKGKLSVEDALQQVLKNALVHDGLARGLRECAKALDKRQAHLCVLVETCTEAEYIKLIEALCAEHKINLIKVGDAKVLGTWAGLCKIDREGNPRKIVGCSCVVVKEYGVESEGLHVLLDYFKNR